MCFFCIIIFLGFVIDVRSRIFFHHTTDAQPATDEAVRRDCQHMAHNSPCFQHTPCLAQLLHVSSVLSYTPDHSYIAHALTQVSWKKRRHQTVVRQVSLHLVSTREVSHEWEKLNKNKLLWMRMSEDETNEEYASFHKS